MRTPKLLGTKIITLLLFSLLSVGGFAQCRDINAEAKVTNSNESGADKPSITIDFKNVNKEPFKVSLFGPDRKNELNVEKSTFENLARGKYLIVIVGKREEDNYCPKSINVTIN